MNPTYDFRDRVAVITGAGSGMGLATARAFAEAGAAVVLADRNEQTLRTATDELTSAGRQALGVACDVSDEEQVAALVERAVADFGRLDFAFNNAGVQAPPTDATDEPAELFDRVNAINLRGVWACMKHELRPMRAQGGGAIVNCSSLGGLVGLPGRIPRLQTRRHRSHQERGPRVRAPRDAQAGARRLEAPPRVATPDHPRRRIPIQPRSKVHVTVMSKRTLWRPTSVARADRYAGSWIRISGNAPSTHSGE
jgi:NAD(P)-dependent dehydrogenase (short-subunit alcohol dehydrogenase family)